MNIGKIVVDWYNTCLTDKTAAGRAARAHLRKCDTALEALSIPETHKLNSSLKQIGVVANPKQLSLIAIIFANIKELGSNKLATTFGKGEPPKLSRLRFLSLIRNESHEELITPLRRSLAVLGSSIPINGYALAEDLYYWSENVRTRWSYQYFNSQFPEQIKED